MSDMKCGLVQMGKRDRGFYACTLPFGHKGQCDPNDALSVKRETPGVTDEKDTQLIREMLEVLKLVEFSNHDPGVGRFCDVCENHEEDKHKAGCVVGEVIKQAELRLR